MGKAQRNKGIRAERTFVNVFKAHGIKAERIPLSGGTSYAKGDIEIEVAGEKWKVESKVRAKGFKQIYDWITGMDALIIKADYQEAIISMPLRKFLSIIQNINNSEGNNENQNTNENQD